MSNSLVCSNSLGVGLWFTHKSSKPSNQLTPVGLNGINKPTKPSNQVEAEKEYPHLRNKLLDSLKLKQDFRIAVGRSSWVNYETFKPEYNLREILNDEVVIEFDSPKKKEEMTQEEQEEFKEIVFLGISATAINLAKAGYEFEYWEHGGKSPHLHIKDLPIAHLEADKRHLFKKIFIKKYVPEEYQKYVDFSLTGVHLIAIEYAPHWKGCYNVKRLVWRYEQGRYLNEVNQ